MELLMIFVIPALIALLQIALALIAGIRLWKQSGLHQPGPARTTLRWLAASLIEPAVNSLLISALLFSPPARSSWSDGLFTTAWVGPAFAVSAPMLVLLLPLIWAAGESAYRGTLLKLGLLGALRWIVTALTLVMPFGIIAGMLVLGFSIRWVKRQGAQISVQYHAIGLGPQGVMVGNAADFQGQGGRPPFAP